ncbi:hypothetical protein DXT99_13325 [Pontibacter diazotrophicus]|uniref:Outer membrane protein beta-barrel domain-containing protein n=1 Tax=Pontibacter diazotrophicus TaxID=1400979 RepID=A0A3D8LBH2_9BACT|nr:hypothetical protein [Pontibacter diazotrophicus]RDV14644.1 hypothetical protein DXT99_13325 [Pontibacter diazotrophicus]
MKTNFTVCALCFILFIAHSPLRAQTQEALSEDQPSKTGLSKIGATFGLGAANMNLKAINSRLQALEIGKLEESSTTFNLSLYSEIYGGLGASFDVSSGYSFDSFAADPHAFLRLTMLSFGANIHLSLLNTNRFQLQAFGGPRFNDMRLTYNTDTRASPDFDDLLTTPSANSSSVALESVSLDEIANVGVRFQYRLGRKENLKTRGYTLALGIDSGYNFSFSDTPWREVHSQRTVQNMPAIEPDNFYLNFTFSAYLLR